MRPDQVQLEYANGLYARKMYEMAAPEYERYMSIYPNAPDRQMALFRLAESNRAMKNTNAAKAAYDSLLTNYSTGEFIGSAAYRLAELYFAEEDYREALPYYRKASIRLKDPLVVNASKYYAARCLENLKLFSEARINYEDLVAIREQNPYREAAWFSLAKLFVDAGRKADAAKQLDQLAQETQKPELKAEALVRAGLLKIDLGQPDKAAADLNKALKFPEIGQWKESAELGLLHLLYDAGKYKQVVETYTAGENAFSKDTRAEVALLAANAYRQLGQQKPAQELYLEVIKDFPDSNYAKDALYEQLVSLYASNDPEVIQKVDEYLKQNLFPEKRDQVTLLKAEALYKSKQYAAAVPVYESLQDTDLPPNLKADSLFKLGWCHTQLGNTDSAAKTFSAFISKYPSNKSLPTALAQRGLAFQQAKNFAGALKDFSDILARFPTAKERELALLQKALILGQQQDNQGMAESFRQLLREFPKSTAAAQANYWIGWAAYEAKNYKDAIAPLENARKLNRPEFLERSSLRLINAHYYLEDQDGLAAEIDAYAKASKSKVPAEVVRWLASHFFENKVYDRAAKYYEMLVNREGETTAADLLNLGKCRLNQQKQGEAVKTFRRYLETPLQPQDKAAGLIAMGQAQLGLEEFADAQKSADEACIHQPEGRLNAEGRMLAGDIAMARQDYENASKIFLSISLVFDDPVLTPQALEKAYVSLLKAGNEVEAKKTLNKLQSQYSEYQMKMRPGI